MSSIKIVGILFASVVALFSALFGVASTMSLGSSDPRERRDATVSAFWSMLTLALCAAVIVSLAGCSTVAKCVVLDNTSNPCR